MYTPVCIAIMTQSVIVRSNISLTKGRKRMSLHRYRKSSTLALASLLLAGVSAFAQQAGDPIRNLTPVTDAMLLNPPLADWLMWRRSFDGYGFSPLEQNDKSSGKDLRVAYACSSAPGTTETTPIVHDG